MSVNSFFPDFHVALLRASWRYCSWIQTMQKKINTKSCNLAENLPSTISVPLSSIFKCHASQYTLLLLFFLVTLQRVKRQAPRHYWTCYHIRKVLIRTQRPVGCLGGCRFSSITRFRFRHSSSIWSGPSHY